ncbi:hypothetical protein LUZ61_019371 [Rhynchospora tenuis]|uniref:Agenet domain-containing protein n=1 Tax=Rhynchospora tenuis TaxID=198213 RepID=A0AAD5ZB83_9POAL|nr:hypothetical protein LUZ61_019371 [Rhynchospora tenuis]
MRSFARRARRAECPSAPQPSDDEIWVRWVPPQSALLKKPILLFRKETKSKTLVSSTSPSPPTAITSNQKIDEVASIAPKTPVSQLTKEIFPVGTEVEVRIDAEGFFGSWYEATVLSYYRVNRRAKYKIQYQEFVLDDGSGEKLVEDALAKDVRPRAPRRFTSHGPSFSHFPNNEDEDPDIKMHDLVEAFHRDGWWHGVVTGLRDRTTGLYTVSFPNSREVLQFWPAEIRPRSAFANGKWSRVLQVQQKTEEFREGDKVEVFRVRDDYGPSYFPARVDKVIHHSYYLVKYESPDAQPNGGLTEILDPQYLRPAVNCMPGTILYMEGSHVEVFCKGGWCSGVVSSGLRGSNYAVTVKYQGEQMTDQFHISGMRLRLEWDGRRWSKWKSPSKAKKRKLVDSNEIFVSDVSLTKSETTPGLVTSPDKKLKKERVKAESSKSTSNSSQVKRAVRKISQSDKLVTELKDCYFVQKKSTGMRTTTCRRNLNGWAWAPDLKQDKVEENNRVAASETQKDLNFSNESSSYVPQSNINASNTNCNADFAEENEVVILPNDGTRGHIPDSEGQDFLVFNQHTLAEHKSVTPDILPFGMTSLWKLLQTTNEVFGHIPQRPHFKKLESECVDKREGAAIGMMVTYAKLVDSIRGLSIHTELKVIESKLECLDSLEENGFMVDPIRSRLHRLLEIKSNYSEFASEWVKLETEVAREKQENKNSLASAKFCEDKSADISKSIAELKEQLSIMEKQKKAVMEEKSGILDLVAKREHNISRIEDEIFIINRSKESASEEFGRVAAEPL